MRNLKKECKILYSATKFRLKFKWWNNEFWRGSYAIEFDENTEKVRTGAKHDNKKKKLKERNENFKILNVSPAPPPPPRPN